MTAYHIVNSDDAAISGANSAEAFVQWVCQHLSNVAAVQENLATT
jgi:hypothetical protein